MSDSKKSSKDASSHTLTDNDIKTERSIGRRSMFALVAGAAGAGLAACVQVNPARTGPTAPTPTTPAVNPGSGINDNDFGNNSDVAGRGIGGATGHTDNDAGDIAGNGIGPGIPQTNLSDSDTQASPGGQDPSGFGRTGV